jgi:hypothetical protein
MVQAEVVDADQPANAPAQIDIDEQATEQLPLRLFIEEHGL